MSLNKKEPWLAVLLSSLWPGLGQFYMEKRWGALIVSITIIGSFSGGLWLLLSPEGDAKQGWAIFVFSIALYIGNLLDAWFSARRWNKNLGEILPPTKKDPYLTIFLTALIPGFELYPKNWTGILGGKKLTFPHRRTSNENP